MIDNGTGYTKMGYSGNGEPTFIVPTAVATAEEGGASSSPLSEAAVLAAAPAPQQQLLHSRLLTAPIPRAQLSAARAMA